MTRRQQFFAAVLLIAVAVLAYWPAISGRAGFIWDDDLHVTEVPALRSWGGLERIWLWPVARDHTGKVTAATAQFYPATFTSFLIEYQLWGTSAQGYHITNFVLHVGNAFLIWLVLVRARMLSSPAAFFAAALFALHPVQVETAAWISERKNTLSTLFFLLATLTFLKWSRIGSEKPASASKLAYAFTLLLFFLALMSKSVTCVLPVTLLLIAWYRRRLDRRVVLGTLPLFVMAVLAGLVTMYVEKTYINAQGADYEIPLLHRVLIAGRAVAFYITSLALPAKLTFIYPRWQVQPSSFAWWIPIGAVLLSLALLFILSRRRPIFRGALAASAFFLIAIAPALGFVNFYPMLYSFVADHFQYLASIGMLALAAGVLGWLLSLIEGKARAITALVVAISSLGLLAFLTHRQTLIYRDAESLWRDTIAKNPRAWMALQNLGDVYVAQNRAAEALPLYRKARELRPQQASIYNAEGLALLHLGKPEEAELVLAMGLDADPENFLLNSTLATALSMRGYYAQAEVNLRRAIEQNPNSWEAWNNLGLALRAQATPEKLQDAVAAFEKAIEINDRNADAYNNLGVALLTQGKLGQAERRFKQAVSIRRDFAEAWVNLGRLHFIKDQKLEAIRAYTQAIDANPKFALALYGMGEVKGSMGLEDEAITYLRAALAMNREMASALGALAEILSHPRNPRNKNILEAIELAERAVSVTKETDPVLLDLLAQVYAQGKRFEAAVETSRKAINRLQAIPPVNEAQLRDMKARLDSYLLQAPQATDLPPATLPSVFDTVKP